MTKLEKRCQSGTEFLLAMMIGCLIGYPVILFVLKGLAK